MRNTAFIFTAGVLAFTLRADAVCDQSSSSQADRDLWAVHGCNHAFFKWEFKAYGLRKRDWIGRGWDDACNISLEYAKHWNAAYLLTYGLPDTAGQFHGTKDYRATAEASASNFHQAIRATIGDGTQFFGSYSQGVVTSYCPLYDFAVYHANPGSRSGTFAHEGWHAWFDKYGYVNGSADGHFAGPMLNCTAPSCDYFYVHGLGDYEFGHMYEQDGTANRFHSPIQVQVEYLCDIADQSLAWVPMSVRIASRGDSNARSALNFINGPGYSCGSASPMGS